jgi:zinc transport system ATP-binding protein
MIPIEIRNLDAGYDGNRIIENINLELKENDFLALIGPNGGGKSTLFKAILGLIKPMAGTVKIFGEEPAGFVSNIGYVPQYEELDSQYPICAREVVQMGLRANKGLRPYYTEEEKEAAERAMEYTEVIDFAHKRISQLSGGQRRRVYLARALAPEPEILMLDEPTASLDPSMQDCTYDILRRLNAKGVAIMLITHDISSVIRDVKRVACLNRSIIVNDAPEITPEMVQLGYHCPPDIIHLGNCTGGCEHHG